MHVSMTANAKSDQILLGVVSKPTSKLDVVNLKLSKMPTALTPPAVSL